MSGQIEQFIVKIGGGFGVTQKRGFPYIVSVVEYTDFVNNLK